MKTKLFIAAAMLLMSTASFAQFSNSGSSSSEQGKMAVGVNVNYGMASDYKSLGFGAKFQYGFAENWRGEFSGNYFLKKDNMTIWDLNLNAHYLIPINEKLNVYPLLGLTMMNFKLDVEGATGLNMGGSLEDFLKSEGLSTSDINLMKQYAPAQYQELVDEYESAKSAVDDASSETRFGINAGCGIEYMVSDNFKINAEVKYQYAKDCDWPVISIGAAYVF